MKAYQVSPMHQTQLKINESQEGECIERKIERILNNNEPITDAAPKIYTERRDGVDPLHNIRTDRFDLALDSTDTIAKSHLAKREEFHNELQRKNDELNGKTPSEEKK